MNAGLLDKILAPRLAAGLAAVCSAGLLATVYAMQYLGGLAPCPLCLLQRWPHAAVVALGLAAACGQRCSRHRGHGASPPRYCMA